MKPLSLHVANTEGRTILKPVLVEFRGSNGRYRQAQSPGGRVNVAGLCAGGPPETWEMRVRCKGYESVGQYITIGRAGLEINVTLPVDPKAARGSFPLYGGLPTDITRMIPEADYLALDDHQKAGLLNIACKARAEGLIDCFLRVEKVQRDRIFVLVSTALGRVIEARDYNAVSGSLHTPPEGFHHLGSYKSNDKFGNIQLTLFGKTGEQDVIADVDIDDAAGLRHAFQVIRNHASGEPTHPYAIREILLGHQGLHPGYGLEV